MTLKALLYKIGLGELADTVASCMPSLFWAKMDLDGERDSIGAFSGERLFTVSQDTDRLELDFIISAAGGHGVMQVADAGSGAVLWQRELNDSAVFTQEVGPLEKGREYAVRFLRQVAGPITVTVSSRSDHIQDLDFSADIHGLARPA